KLIGASLTKLASRSKRFQLYSKSVETKLEFPKRPSTALQNMMLSKLPQTLPWHIQKWWRQLRLNALYRH
ncbi:hypothetical protein G1E_36155, partial [Pseudomonas sp. TJI-51]